MYKEQLNLLACPKCGDDIILSSVEEMSSDRVKAGELSCPSCNQNYPIIEFIPRFVPVSNYANNFGFQWNHYTESQYDSRSGLSISKDRFYRTTNWPEVMSDELLLEAGCGAGRFTEVVLATGATLVSFDYSNAVDANYKMNGGSRNLLVLQADIFSPPLKKGLFDRVYCMGVLQHTPDPKKAFKSLPRFVKDQGLIAIDVYLKENFWKWLTSYYRIHWFTRHISVNKIHFFFKIYVDLTWPIVKWLWSFGRTGRRIARYVFLMKDRFWRKGMMVSDEVQKESLVLHFIDQLCAYYDKPQYLSTVESWFGEEKIENIEVFKGGNGVIGRGNITIKN